MVACPEVFGGSPGPEKDCGWYCEFVLGSETWAFGRMYVVQFIAVALLASVQAMKQRKFPAPIVIPFLEIGLYVVWFFARLGGAVEVILRENMKPQLGDIALPRKADRISKAEECYQSIGLQQTLAMGVSSTSIFQQPVRD